MSIFLQSRTQATEVASDKTGWLKASLVELSDPVLPVVPSPKLTGEIHTYARAQESPYLYTPFSNRTLHRRPLRPFATVLGHNSKVNNHSIERNASRNIANHNPGEQSVGKDNLCINSCTEDIAQAQTYPKKPDVCSPVDLVELLDQSDQQTRKSVWDQSGTAVSRTSLHIDGQSAAVHNAFPTRLPSSSPRLSDTDADTNFADIVIPGDLSSSKIGPPPFPLSLLPERQLKQLIRSSCARNTVRTSPASFGSWHGANRSLPLAGFHSYIHSRNQITAYQVPYNSRKASTSMRYNIHSAHTTESFQPVRKASTNQLKVAVYPVYRSTFQVSSY